MSEAPALSIAELDVVSKFGLDKPEEATVSLLPTRGIRGPWGYPKVRGVCPSCGALALFAASGGYITCANLQCPNPTAVADSLEKPVVLSPKDEPTADEAWLVFARARTVDYDEWRAEYPDAEDDEEVAFRAGFEAREPSQPKLDPKPWVCAEGYRTEVQAWHPTHGLSEFAPGPQFSQVESQYPHRKATA